MRLRQALRKRCVSLAFPKARRKRLRAEAKLACKLDRSRKGLDALDFGAVICHETLSVPFFDRYLSGRGGAIPLGLMSHAPQLPSEEVYDDLLVNGNGPAAAERAQARMREIERAAFSRADFYVFPSREAMEPYAALAPLMAGKPFVPAHPQARPIRHSRQAMERHRDPKGDRILRLQHRQPKILPHGHALPAALRPPLPQMGIDKIRHPPIAGRKARIPKAEPRGGVRPDPELDVGGAQGKHLRLGVERLEDLPGAVNPRAQPGKEPQARLPARPQQAPEP